MALKFGRRAPKNAPAIALGDVLSGVVPEHPVRFDFIFENMENWKLLGNDQIGDCVAVTWANAIRTVTTLLGEKEYYPTFEEVLAVYKTQNPKFPSQDDGMDIQTLLEYLLHNGGPDGRKPVAFARVHAHDLEEVKAALAIFGTLWLGLTVKQGNMEDFYNKRPWVDHPSSPIVGRHAVMGGGYLGTPEADLRFVTWGEETALSQEYISLGLMDEAWVVVWPENLGTKQFQEGINLDLLKQYYKVLTGSDMDTSKTTSSPGCLLGALKKVESIFRG